MFSTSIYLASQSPRRRDLLTQIGIDYEVILNEIDESILPNETPESYVKRLATEKAKAGQYLTTENKPVLGADTVVVLDNLVMGKPVDEQHAMAMLLSLSGREHQVMTAVALVLGDEVRCEVVITKVTFRSINKQEALDYWQTNEPKDKAGGYGIQGFGAQFVEKIDGCYFAVVGLPLMKTQQMLKSLVS
jgi:septum formation protein